MYDESRRGAIGEREHMNARHVDDANSLDASTYSLSLSVIYGVAHISTHDCKCPIMCA